MAGALVGGAFLSAFLQVLFDRMASPRILDFLRSRKIVEAKVTRLKTTLLAINSVLQDAEDKQIVNENVKEWLSKLQDVVYDAEDLLDQIDYEALRFEIEKEPPSFMTQVKSYFSSMTKNDRKMKSKLGEVLDRLQHMVEQIQFLGLNQIVGQKAPQREQSSSLLVEDHVYGRDPDVEAIMNFLRSEDADRNAIDVISIVGMGGIGKTTLAQLVYNDSKVKELFKTRAWVCVSEETDSSRLTGNILQDVTKQLCHVSSLNQLQLQLEEKLRGNKFLIVLDDVWNMDFIKWNILMAPLRSGAKGSRIILTTRNQTIADTVQRFSTYFLKELSDDDCWSLFKEHAFAKVEVKNPSEMEATGRKIVNRCSGLPLAVKAIAGMLRSKDDVNEWERILKSNIWSNKTDVFSVLRISYHYLPPKLKRCFVYCSIFPKDYKFKEEELVRLWMAEGFLDQSGQDEMEEIGKEYFKELTTRSFFQPACDDESRFIMHDLIRRLSKDISRETCHCLGEDYFSGPARHLAFVNRTNDFSDLKYVEGLLCLRTFLIIDENCYKRTVPTNLTPLLQEVRLLRVLYRNPLRVLSLKGCKGIYDLPWPEGVLKHLRYLDLSETSIRKLPKWVISLYKLQVLLLFECQMLVALPMDLAKLKNLGVLDIRGRGSTISELKDLQHLQGTLEISNLENITSVEDARDADLKGKRGLKGLTLSWNNESAGSSMMERCILDELEPNTSIESLAILNYSGTIVPCWVETASFSSLTSLKLIGWKHCFSLPCLGQLPSLKELEISEFDSVWAIGYDFIGRFISLEKLCFRGMSAWKLWHYSKANFPCMKELALIDCPKLQDISHVVWAPHETELENSEMLRIEIQGCHSIRSLPLHWFPTAVKISISDCKNLESLICEEGNLKDLVSLEEIKILSCPMLVSFSGRWISLKNLTMLSITDCRNLNPSHFDFPLSLHILTIDLRCDLKGWGLQKLPYLLFLEFYGTLGEDRTEELVLNGEFLPKSLSSLAIYSSKNLKSIDEEGLQHLTSLKHLNLWDCPNLQSMSVQRLPASLSELNIWNCPLLAQRCQDNKRDFLSRIPVIKIDGNVMS